MSNYWKPTTPEQIASFKERRKIINKASKARAKLRQQGLLEASKMGRGDALTPEQRERRNELQRARREKAKEGRVIKLDKTKPRTLTKLTPEQAKERRAEQQRRSARKMRALRKEKPVQVVTAKPRRLPIGRKEKPQPKRMANRPDDPLKVRRELKPGLWIYTYPDADLDAKRTKYGIAI